MTVEIKRIVCLANSYRPSGRCIAGKEVLPDGGLGGWLRPVSSPEEGGVGEERLYEDRSEPNILDVVNVPVLKHQPLDHQQENWLLDPDSRWVRTQRLASSDLEQYIDPVEPLWIDGSSGSNGENDRVPFSDAKSLEDSLRLIRINTLELSVSLNNRDERSVRGGFRYAGSFYLLSVTDPIFRDRYLQLPNDNYRIREILVTVSLGGPVNFGGYIYCYKLIAAIIEL